MKTKFTFAALFCAVMLYAARVVVPASALPHNAQTFINTYFKNAQIGLVKQDLGSFDVVLNDGTEIDFIINGEWKKIDGKYKPIPTDFLPPQIVSSAKAAQPNAQIFKVDKEMQGYKFKFDNGMQIYTDFNGNILEQRFAKRKKH